MSKLDWEKRFRKLIIDYEKDSDMDFWLDACLYGEILDFIKTEMRRIKLDTMAESLKDGRYTQEELEEALEQQRIKGGLESN